MLLQRALVTLVLLPLGLLVIYLGSPAYIALVALILALAAWELHRLYRASGHQPAGFLIVGGSLLLVLGRAADGFSSAPWMLSLLVLLSMGFHLVAFERGRERAATDFMVTLSGALYIGWLGAYLISIRNLPDGLWWLLLVLPCVWLADSAAYFIGRRFGRRKLSPRLSPKKTWEGYLAGIVAGTVSGALLGWLYTIIIASPTAIGPLPGAILGLILSVLTTLGDLGESMIKRQSGMKDSGTILPGHGGMFDRIDSWLWAAVIGYYTIVWLFI
jgi:phosphatidate cytidylyltransferase